MINTSIVGRGGRCVMGAKTERLLNENTGEQSQLTDCLASSGGFIADVLRTLCSYRSRGRPSRSPCHRCCTSASGRLEEAQSIAQELTTVLRTSASWRKARDRDVCGNRSSVRQRFTEEFATKEERRMLRICKKCRSG